VGLAFQDRELMAQHEDLGVLGLVPVATEHQQVEDESDETVETSHPQILLDVTPADQFQARNRSSRARTSLRHAQVAVP
jgi:hypothetical protein